MSAYVVFEIEVSDPERYERYKALSGPAVAAAGGRYLARGGRTASLEGAAAPSRSVVIEFDSLEAAVAWYEGEAYTAARALREGAATARAYVVEGP
ncbi:MAG TPA: DUF1330 domain-containing protein [Acidimicrobiales bacterium]|nr:MAG: hypothetical protein B7Z69_00205 [Actinobacteria bacterium 21-73-9]HQU26480.1 DUF1330 domain-containing protein [Acidimicrobiales bacterium]